MAFDPHSARRRRRRQGPAAARRHPPARPHPRRHGARAGGRGDLRAGRADPPGLDPLPPRTTRPARGASSRRCSTALSADQTLAIVRAFSYFSHLANIAEDQHHIRRNRAHAIAGSAPAPGLARLRLPAHARGGRRARAARRLLRPRAGEPGADRPPDRSAPQEHAHPRARNRRPARRARPGARRCRTELAFNEERLRRAVAHPLAHQHAAPDAAAR